MNSAPGCWNASIAIATLAFLILFLGIQGVITALTDGVQETRNGIREARALAAAQVVSTIGRGTSKLDGGLATIESAPTGYGTQVSEQWMVISDLRARVTLWLDLAAATATLALLWSALSQAIVFVVGLSVYRNENLFARWIQSRW